jgi:hypothetical protein
VSQNSRVIVINVSLLACSVSNAQLLPFSRPWQASLCKYSEAYDAGMISGDMEYAVQNMNFHCMTSVFGCGSNLKELDKDLEKHMKRAIQ